MCFVKALPTVMQALPPYFGGKRELLPLYFDNLSQIIPISEWEDAVFLDAFAGGDSVSLAAKFLNFRELHANDWSDRSQSVFQGLLMNDRVLLTKEDVQRLKQPLPKDIRGFVSEHLVPQAFSSRHAEALDRVRHWASQFLDPAKQNLSLLLLWHLLLGYTCMPTSVGNSNRPYAEAMDGIRGWGDINPKRFLDGSIPRLLKPRWNKVEALRKRINGGVFAGSAVKTYQMDAIDFIQQTQGDVLFLDPPYAGTLSYERSLKTLDAVLMGKFPEEDQQISSFTKGVDTLGPLLESARHVPIWMLTYANNVIELPELVALVQDMAPNRTVKGIERAYRHMPHVAKAQNRKELLVIAHE